MMEKLLLQQVQAEIQNNKRIIVRPEKVAVVVHNGKQMLEALVIIQNLFAEKISK